MFRKAAIRAHLQSETFGTGTQDVDWLPHVGANGWILITKDKNIRKRPLELRALRESGVRAFVLTSGNLSGSAQADVFREALAAMLRLIRRKVPPFVARVTSESSVELINIEKYIGADQS